VGHGGRDAGLTRHKGATRTRGEGENETGAEGEEERGGHEHVRLGEHDTHSLGDETVHEEEHECMEKDSHLTGLTVHELDILTRDGDEHAWAECKKKSGRDGDFLRSDIREHLIYTHIIFCKV